MDLREWGMNAVTYSSTGNYPHGDAINQWVQQVRRVVIYRIYSIERRASSKRRVQINKRPQRLFEVPAFI